MGFRRLFGAFGVGGLSVETVLATSQARPGDYLAGEVRIAGGGQDVVIHQVALSLVTRAEDEHSDNEFSGIREFYRGAITGAFVLGAGQRQAIPFQMPLPWELPATEVYGQHLHGMVMGVSTELEVAGAVDSGDLDAISVSPLPSQQRVLDAFGALGFGFKNADVEEGRVAGVHQELPFYQEIEFYAPPQYSGQVNEVELTFVTDPGGLVVILEADRRGNMFSEGDDVFGRFHVTHEEALHTAWEHELKRWLGAVAGHLHGGHGFAHRVPHDAYGHHAGHHGEHSNGHGPGWGGVAAGVVGGAAAGFVAGAVVNEMLDGDDQDDEEPSVGDVFADAADDAVQDAYQQVAYEQAYEAAYQNAYEETQEDSAQSFGSEVFESED
ncbi:sporulation protein [Actinomadura syzygii]|uniref:Sporulation protein n=1 Tax=Actinomadura syzygii TaxID=1427538 RepID=A0A5D0TQU9_9ACTN|nr:sporulation protein [Actinomadura syzygii]TYC07389.1 sporulation protein [Actinomadura syzygii]